MDALKLQPANPTLLRGPDAILQADAVLTGGANQDQIWQAFARRGLGVAPTPAAQRRLADGHRGVRSAGRQNPVVIRQARAVHPEWPPLVHVYLR